MDDFLDITKALADASRVRVLMALEGGELRLCQIIDLLGLAPSTVSKHVNLLVRAGLVEQRKDGRWRFFRLAGTDASPTVRSALEWTLEALRADPLVQEDAGTLERVREKELEELCECYRS